jgi:hypothetical protein
MTIVICNYCCNLNVWNIIYFLKNNAHNPFPSGLVYFSGVEDQVFLEQKLNIRNFIYLTSVNGFDEEYLRSLS